MKPCILLIASFCTLNFPSLAQDVRPLITFPRVNQIENFAVFPDWTNKSTKTFLLSDIVFPQPSNNTLVFAEASPYKQLWNINPQTSTLNFTTPIKIPPNHSIRFTSTGVVLISGYFENELPTYTKEEVNAALDSLNKKIDSTKHQIFQAINTQTTKALNEIQQDEIMNRLKSDITNNFKNLDLELKKIKAEIEAVKNRLPKKPAP